MKKNTMVKMAVLTALLIGVFQCKEKSDGQQENAVQSNGEQVVNIYSSRHYDVDKEIYKKFTEKTGIKINVVEGKNDELLQRILQEGEGSPADLYLTVGAENIYPLKENQLLKTFSSSFIEENIPADYRGNGWTGITSRARVIAYNKNAEKVPAIKSYNDLTAPEWKNKILVRSSASSYNIALLASFVELEGKDKATQWGKGIVANMARIPKGNDRDQAKAVIAEEGELAIMNSYYLVKMLNSSDRVEADVGRQIGLIFPENVHINLSFCALLTTTKNQENAIKFLEYVSSPVIQKIYAEENGEFPLNSKVSKSDIQKSWGEFQAQKINFEELGKYKKEAAFIFDKVGWK